MKSNETVSHSEPFEEKHRIAKNIVLSGKSNFPSKSKDAAITRNKTRKRTILTNRKWSSINTIFFREISIVFSIRKKLFP